MTTQYHSQILQVLSAHAELNQDVATIGVDDDLFAAGMSSRATVGVMLGLESTFDIEFPDAMLRRDVFESIRAIGLALDTIKS